MQLVGESNITLYQFGAILRVQYSLQRICTIGRVEQLVTSHPFVTIRASQNHSSGHLKHTAKVNLYSKIKLRMYVGAMYLVV